MSEIFVLEDFTFLAQRNFNDAVNTCDRRDVKYDPTTLPLNFNLKLVLRNIPMKPNPTSHTSHFTVCCCEARTWKYSEHILYSSPWKYSRTALEKFRIYLIFTTQQRFHLKYRPLSCYSMKTKIHWNNQKQFAIEILRSFYGLLKDSVAIVQPQKFYGLPKEMKMLLSH